MTVLLGGRDAPMGPSDQRLFKLILAEVLVLSGALLLVALLT